MQQRRGGIPYRGDGRLDRRSSWSEAVFSGRSRAEREADHDLIVRGLLVVGCLVALMLLGLKALFAALGLQFGLWALPALAPALVWLFASALAGRPLRPLQLDTLAVRRRLAGGVGLLVLLWSLWPLWANPTAAAWRAAHGGFASVARTGTPSFPLHAALGASPVALGVVAFLILAAAMTIAPNPKARDQRPLPPPGGPQPIDSPLAAPPPWRDPRAAYPPPHAYRQPPAAGEGRPAARPPRLRRW